MGRSVATIRNDRRSTLLKNRRYACSLGTTREAITSWWSLLASQLVAAKLFRGSAHYGSIINFRKEASRLQNGRKQKAGHPSGCPAFVNANAYRLLPTFLIRSTQRLE